LGKRPGIGQILIQRGVITEQQLREALDEQRKSSSAEKLGAILVRLGHATEDDVALAYAQQMGVEVVDFAKTPVEKDVLRSLPRQTVDRYMCLPVRRLEDGTLLVAMADPGDVVAKDDIRRQTGSNIKVVAATPSEIRETIGRVYDLLDEEEFQSSLKQVEESRTLSVQDQKATSELGGDDGSMGMGDDMSTDISQMPPIVKMCTSIIKQAIRDGCSDIHIEPSRTRVRIRYREDGVLREVMPLPKYVHAPLISRIKIMGNMDIAEKRIPQDGHVHVRVDKREFDLRISTIPTTNGEKAVLRILDQSNVLIGLDKLGFLPDTLASLEELVAQPNGMILSTGPTGHGKTTTQLSILSKLNSVTKNIMTIEEPVEYQVPNINQVEVNRKAGLTFANALRSFLRQDPDIIMVGEIRDLETAEIAIQAALTGHLVLSTLHTNDAPSAVTRLVDMGVEPFLISASVIGVLAQRLARRICPECKQEWEPPEEMLRPFGWDPSQNGNQVFYRGAGCDYCRGTGYKGRVGIFEFMTVNSEIQELIVRRAPLADVREAARANGMRTLREDGFRKVLLGITTPDEVQRVVFTAGVE